INPAAPGGRGATTGGNAAAWEDAKQEVARFFSGHLRRAGEPRARPRR
ncbi:MAG: hypothetical protein K0R40_2707, partial [Burkholderiales bacterium]|nr:hypothetical protein [Burkholderiales bacterium]